MVNYIHHSTMTSLLLLKSMLLANAVQKSKKKRKKSNVIPKLSPKSKNTNMCRICYEEKGEIPIFNNIVHPNLSEEIHNFSGVMVENSDKLPIHMCQNCLDLLNGCIMFREMCQKTNKKMIEMAIKKEANVEPSTDCNNYTKYNEAEQHVESDCSYNIPSPNYSDDYTVISCTFCDKEFLDLASYNSHISHCHNDEPRPKRSEDMPKKRFLCDVCGKTTKSRASLLVHKTTHSNIFPFKCEICPYQGRTMDLLKVHKRTHLTEAEKPYKCAQCGKTTTSASNLAKHTQHVHSSNRPYKCNYCEKAFSFQHDMKRHVKDIHLRQGTVECQLCFKKFNTKKILRGHQFKVHKMKGERQGRLPSYLQCQTGPCENINDSELDYILA